MNILLKPWTDLAGGCPRFDQVSLSDFIPALEEGMRMALDQVVAIADCTEPPTFENTVEAYELVGEALDRAHEVYLVWAGNMSSDEFRQIQQEMQPRLAAFRDQILQNERLFRRFAAIYQTLDDTNLSAVQKRLVWQHYTNFVRSGATLTAEQKSRAAEINQLLAGLSTRFSNNVLHDEEHYALYLDDGQLDGLAPEFLEGAAAAAKERGREGQYAILNTRSSVEPFLTYSPHRELREQVWRAFYGRGDQGGDHDNNGIIADILRLRAERSALQGYASFAVQALETEVAKTPETASALLAEIWPAAVAQARREIQEIQAAADEESAGIQIRPWDHRYYAEKVRQAKYDVDSNKLKEYLQLEKLREGMMWVADRLFGFAFTPAPETSVYHPDVRVWKVTHGGGEAGLWYFDPYARPGKRSGAWMSAYRPQKKVGGDQKTIVSNNLNLVRGTRGAPTLVSWDDARTLFHEFGHAMHGLCADVDFPSQSGTNVPRDYVEFPSQLFERWLLTPEVVNGFLLHHVTGESCPQELVQRVELASRFSQGFSTTEYLGCAQIDLKLHGMNVPESFDPAEFERRTLTEIGMPDEIPMRHRTAQFGHIFNDEGYAARYYSYLWADSLAADAWEAFLEAGGPFDPRVAESLLKNVLSAGNTIDPADAYRSFRGRDAGTGALARHRGFA